MSNKEEIKGYLLFDHGGVLDGTPADPTNPIQYNPETDLVTAQDADGMSFLPHGIAIFKMLYELDLNGYKILYASANKEIDQLKIKNALEKDARKKSLKYPAIYAMPVLDKDLFKNATVVEPEIIRDRNHGVIIVGIGSDGDLNGKAFLRRALENSGVINPELRKNSIVFDDGPTVVRHAQREAYQAYRVGEPLAENDYGDGPAIPGGELYEGVRAFYDNAKQQVKTWILDFPASQTEESESEEPEKTVKNPSFPFNSVLGSNDEKQLIKYMNWKAWPPIFAKTTKENWFRLEVTRYTRNLQIEHLIKDKEVQRTLFNFAVYRALMRFGEAQNAKRNNIDTFLQSLNGKSLEEADGIIDAALKNEDLIKNNGIGFFRFFHSVPKGIHNEQMDNRFARSTTEELLIELSHAVKGAISKAAEPDESSSEPTL